MFELTGPIVHSRLEPDFYKFTMGQLIWRKYGDVETTFSFKNRTPKARIGDVVEVRELREHSDHARSLMFTNTELHYPAMLIRSGFIVRNGRCSMTGGSNTDGGSRSFCPTHSERRSS